MYVHARQQRHFLAPLRRVFPAEKWKWLEHPLKFNPNGKKEKNIYIREIKVLKKRERVRDDRVEWEILKVKALAQQHAGGSIPGLLTFNSQ
jgi:hypothetical protein